MQGRFWLFPAAFIVHDSEEILTLPAWIASHQSVLNRVAQTNRLAAIAVENLPRTTAAVAIAVGAELLVIAMATLAVTRRPRGASLNIYAALLGLFTLHALTHYGQALFFHGYTPGLITAALIIPAFSGHLYRRLVPDPLSVRAAVMSAAIGLLLFLPIVELAQLAGHALTS